MFVSRLNFNVLYQFVVICLKPIHDQELGAAAPRQPFPVLQKNGPRPENHGVQAGVDLPEQGTLMSDQIPSTGGSLQVSNTDFTGN